ncbi:hypothetical protein [Jonesia denitrificans]|uniref:RNHCP domain-containing protein n=1 Tax=Jonesia denitrificans (strain ATCC 14870 / DSM 20603 / BCRC 15368 / CIP 55.134 / JCM 11481 / NBRC 15587 / NCTC 10816 / Prevot 55134) TaxID=471856 RepID=C7R0F8_JONDD|nr:hypothetical protein [Jonesia denitrificans]ACV09622.1 hypothetical protein Jden_1984 [Jonesia denitrificans DSM 20603]QXB43699.1 hypothetical protein I6L70_02040 [Jonesia denitrificans]SQH22100.1 Uncharacterised protein [Jonesia denitrificans]
MTVLLQRPVTLDINGVEHRFSCSMPGYTLERGRSEGFVIARCNDCGAMRIINEQQAA